MNHAGTQIQKLNSQIVIDIAHQKIHEGDHYFVDNYVDLASGTSRQFILATPNTDKRIHFCFEIEFEKESTIVITEGVTTDADGTAIVELNNERNSNNEAVVVITHTPTNPAGGTVIYQHRKGDTKKTGGGTRSESEWVLKKNTKYLIDIANNGGTDNLINWHFNWYEV